MPSAYRYLQTLGDIKSIAEYPLERLGMESDAITYYLTMQMVHGKPLLNSSLTKSTPDNGQELLKDLSAPGTVQKLRLLGISAVVVHGIPSEQVAKIPHLTVIYEGNHVNGRFPPTSTIQQDSIVIARIQ